MRLNTPSSTQDEPTSPPGSTSSSNVMPLSQAASTSSISPSDHSLDLDLPQPRMSNITSMANMTDMQALIDRADQDSALMREQREALHELKDIFIKDIGERKKERAEQKQSEKDKIEIAQQQHNDIVTSIKEQQSSIARQQDLMFELIKQLKK